jgi:hypothetical protein
MILANMTPHLQSLRCAFLPFNFTTDRSPSSVYAARAHRQLDADERVVAAAHGAAGQRELAPLRSRPAPDPRPAPAVPGPADDRLPHPDVVDDALEPDGPPLPGRGQPPGHPGQQQQQLLPGRRQRCSQRRQQRAAGAGRAAGRAGPPQRAGGRARAHAEQTAGRPVPRGRGGCRSGAEREACAGEWR